VQAVWQPPSAYAAPAAAAPLAQAASAQTLMLAGAPAALLPAAVLPPLQQPLHLCRQARETGTGVAVQAGVTAAVCCA
jgi:hypothetical protein